MDNLAQQLAIAIPCDRVFIHRHAGILRVVDQGVAHCLHILTEGTHLMECMYFAIYRICTYMIGIDLHGVGMKPHGVFLRKVDGNGILGGKAITCLFVVTQVVAGKRVLVLLVHIHHIAITATVAILHIIQAVARDRLVLIRQGGATIQLGTLGFGVVITILGMDDTVAGNHFGRTYHVSLRLGHVII